MARINELQSRIAAHRIHNMKQQTHIAEQQTQIADLKIQLRICEGEKQSLKAGAEEKEATLKARITSATETKEQKLAYRDPILASMGPASNVCPSRPCTRSRRRCRLERSVV